MFKETLYLWSRVDRVYVERMEENVDDTATLSMSLFMDNEMILNDEFMFSSTEQFSNET